MRINHLWLTDIGPFTRLNLAVKKRDQGIDPNRADTVVIVGPNGSGKSTLLFAIAGLFAESAELSERMRSNLSTVLAEIELSDGLRVKTLGGRDITMVADIGITMVADIADPFNRYNHRGYSRFVPKDLGSEHLDIMGRVDSAPLLYAYAGARTAPANGSLLEHEGRAGAPQFDKSHAFYNFADWASDIMGRRDGALVAGNDTKAREVAEGLYRMEVFISEITERESAFVRNFDNGAIELRVADDQIPLSLLPEGLKSILCWVGDLLRRLYSLTTGGVPQYKLPIVLLLDEIDVHLHPTWQRKVLPALEELLPNAQIFLTTHSPFVVGSASDTQIVWLDEGGLVRSDPPTDSLRGYDYTSLLELMGITSLSDERTAQGLRELNRMALDVRNGKATMENFDDVASKLPDVEDVQLAVDMKRAEIHRTRKDQ